MKSIKSIITVAVITISFGSSVRSWAETSTNKNLAEQIFDTMLQVHGVESGARPVHAKGIVCQGTFTPNKDAAALSVATHFNADSTPVTIRFSDASPSTSIADGSPDANARGMAVRFLLPGGKKADIVANSHNGFIVGNGQEFLQLQKSIVATDPSKPHPWPVEVFIGSHPAALRFVQSNTAIPVSFATETFFSNNSFIFINQSGAKQAFRYQLIPVAGAQNLSDADAKTKAPNFLFDDLKTRLASGPIKFKLIAQLPNSGDVTSDPSVVWPDDRKTVDLGTITVTAIAPDTDAANKSLAFDPTNFTDGIESSDDSLPGLRSSVYKMSAEHRHAY